jgi:putative transposase
MSRYKILGQDRLHFVTLTVVDWVDIFIRKSYKDIVIESLKYCQANKGLEVFGYVIMSSHLLLIVRTAAENELSDVLRDFKKYTAKQILQAIEHGGYESRRKWLLHRFAYRGTAGQDKRINFGSLTIILLCCIACPS